MRSRLGWLPGGVSGLGVSTQFQVMITFRSCSCRTRAECHSTRQPTPAHPVATTRPTIGSAPKGDLGPRRSLCKPVGTSRHTLSSSGTLASIETIRSLIVSPTAYTTTCVPSAPLQSFPPFGCASPPTDGRHQSGRTTSQGLTILSVSLRVANEQFTPFPVTCYPQRPASLLR